jgi:hypothetical protein
MRLRGACYDYLWQDQPVNRVFVSIAAVLVGLSLAACTRGGPGIPRTAANVAVCKVLRDTLAGRATMPKLAGALFETNALITHRLRQDIGSYISLTASGGGSAAQQAKAQAEQDCAAIGVG